MAQTVNDAALNTDKGGNAVDAERQRQKEWDEYDAAQRQFPKLSFDIAPMSPTDLDEPIGDGHPYIVVRIKRECYCYTRASNNTKTPAPPPLYYMVQPATAGTPITMRDVLRTLERQKYRACGHCFLQQFDQIGDSHEFDMTFGS